LVLTKNIKNRLYSLGYFAGPDAPCADILSDNTALLNNPDSPDVGAPYPACLLVGMADIMSELNSLPAYIAFSHISLQLKKVKYTHKIEHIYLQELFILIYNSIAFTKYKYSVKTYYFCHRDTEAQSIYYYIQLFEC
jgi:hypothetical protein